MKYVPPVVETAKAHGGGYVGVKRGVKEDTAGSEQADAVDLAPVLEFPSVDAAMAAADAAEKTAGDTARAAADEAHRKALETLQECPLEETPVERLKRAFQEFTETFESSQ